MSSASWALQEAIYTCLSSDDDLIALVSSLYLYDAPPRDASYPYLVLDEDEETAWDTATSYGSEHTIHIDIFSQSGGRKEVKRITSALRDALEEADLDPDGQKLIRIAFKSAAYSRLEDGQSYQGRITFSALTEPES